MYPKGKRHLIDETSKKTGVDEVKTEAILTYYWRHVRNFMQVPTETSIFLNNLGTFSLVPYFVDQYILDKEAHIERMERKMAKGEPLREAQLQYYLRCKDDIVWLRERRDDLKELKQTKKTKKQLRNEHIKTKLEADSQGLVQSTLQEQESGGDSREENCNMQE